MIGWALRWVVLCCGLVLLVLAMRDRGAALLPNRDAATAPAPRAAAATFNTIVYTANEHGHVIVEAAVNGARLRMLVDTGATLVTLTPEDARAAGIDPAGLTFTRRVSTANGTARMAPVMLREVRIEQLSVYDVPAAVLENLNFSLLGMSFLSRLRSYEMSDGKLTIMW